MPYNLALADKVERLLRKMALEPELKKMFGGICFLIRGHMLCGLVGSKLMLRVGAEQYSAALRNKHASEMKFTGRAMKGFIFISPAGVSRTADLQRWLKLGLAYNATLPEKQGGARRASIRKRGGGDDITSQTPIAQLKNFGPITRGELEAMGVKTFGQLEKLGFEGACRKYARYFPERLNANAFLGVLCTLEQTVWTQASPVQRQRARSLATQLRREQGGR